MAESGKAEAEATSGTSETDDYIQYIRWDGADWKRVTDAIERFRKQHGVAPRATEVVRSAALRWADSILEAA